MEKLSDKEWWALRRYNTAPLSEIWRDAIDIVLLQRSAEKEDLMEWKDELLKEFDTAAGTILEDAGCLHDDGLVCEICQPFVDARKKYADHINVPKPKTTEEHVHEMWHGGDQMSNKWEIDEDGYEREQRLVSYPSGLIVGRVCGSNYDKNSGWIAWREEKEVQENLGTYVTEGLAKKAIEAAQPDRKSVV